MCTLLATVFVFAGLTHILAAETSVFTINDSQITGPAEPATGHPVNPATNAVWLKALQKWRAERRSTNCYNAALYQDSRLDWAQRNFVQPQVMVEDRYLYDPAASCYTVDRLLDDLKRRYGGVESVLLWPVYPNIGVDSRNQWDLARDLPGGAAGTHKMVADFHRRGVRVFFPTMPWDTGTRDPQLSQAQATAGLMAEIGADGINGDTCHGLQRDYFEAAVAAGHPLVLEPEFPMAEEAMLEFNLQGWAYWNYPFEPMVSKWKWLEPRHMLNVCNRWATDRTDDLQAAFFNGVGVESWENIWGFWNQFTDRDAESLRRIAAIYRAFPKPLVSADWTPHVPTLCRGVYASCFPAAGCVLWTVVNRNDFDLAEAIISVPDKPMRRYFDIWNGQPLNPHFHQGQSVLDLPLEPHGYGAILAVDKGADVPSLAPLLRQMRQLSRKPLQSYSSVWHFLPQKLVDTGRTTPATDTPAEMVRIPAGEFVFQVSGVEIEGANRVGLDVQYPWEDSPRRNHFHRMSIKTFFIDRFPVTNAKFKTFLDSTRYSPKDEHNFLKDWVNGAPPPGWANRPVTWVSIEDARAYAKWASKRLPHEWEWQYAAQGCDRRLYPWGDIWNDGLTPDFCAGRDLPPPATVGLHPGGASPYGVEDLVGTVWQWTDEFVDDHTRAAIVRGGSSYRPQNSRWYFPQVRRLDEHGKYLLMAPSKDRSGMIGFRCAKDAE